MITDINTASIITKYDPPPIPLRQFDWSAVRDNYEPCMRIGWGRTALTEKFLSELESSS